MDYSNCVKVGYHIGIRQTRQDQDNYLGNDSDRQVEHPPKSELPLQEDRIEDPWVAHEDNDAEYGHRDMRIWAGDLAQLMDHIEGGIDELYHIDEYQ